MSFRTRLTLAAAAAVAVAVVGASAITYALVRNELRSQVDQTLQERAATLQIGVGGRPAPRSSACRRSRSVAPPSSHRSSAPTAR